ncbi:MAG TPA: PA-phosphatase [Cyclobacteriaceae bacterium]|nr:PA-phosphatase [Cyclobacteriaceae bacterium]
MNLLARFISVLFHPLMMATYLCAILMLTYPPALDPVRAEIFSGFLLLIFFVTFLLPAINIGIFRFFGTIPSVMMTERRDRIIPFVFILLFYVMMTALFYWKFHIGFRDNVFKFLIIIDLLVIASTLITFFYKVSVHAIGICGLLGILVPLNKISEDHNLFYPTIGLIVAAGGVMSARLYLNVHTLREVMIGAMVGFVISFVSVIVFF